MAGWIRNWWGKQETRVADIAEGRAPAELPLPSDTSRSIRVGALILVIGFGGFLLWAVTVPLDEGVPTQGTVTVESKRKTVQHHGGGIIKEILVREADVVKAGAPLIRLDDTQTSANYESALQIYYSMLAVEARLRAENAGAKTISFPEVLTLEPVSPTAREHMQLQRRVFDARRLALEGELAVLTESASNYENQARGFEEQIGFLKQELAGMRELAKEGYVSRNQQFATERQYADLQASMSRARQSASEMRLRALQRKQEFRRDIELQLADVTRDLVTNRERVRFLRDELDRTIVRAPVDGAVNGLAVTTVGGVVPAGGRVADIVPANERLLLETRVPSHLIDSVQSGQPTDINIHAFAQNSQMVLQGRILSVSADLMTDPNPAVPPYYLARVEVTPEGMKALGAHQLQPGMPADVVIKTGERTMLTYLMKPLLRRLATSLTEL